MRRNKSTRLSWIVLPAVLAVTCVCGVSAGANGDRYDFQVGQRENNQDLDPVAKYVLKYEVTSATTCYSGQAWCTKTGTSSTKLMHWHNVDTDLTGQQPTRADTYADRKSTRLNSSH
jgi:hypothetical protein